MGSHASFPLKDVADALVNPSTEAISLTLETLSNTESNFIEALPGGGVDAFAGILYQVLANADEYGHLSEEFCQQLAELAFRVDEYGFMPTDYYQLKQVLHLILAHSELCTLPFHQVLAAARAFAQACDELAQGATTNTFITADVVEVEKRCRQIMVVRLIARQGLDYTPGQFIEVSSDFTQNHWMPVYPSIPANEAGMLEVHLHINHNNRDPHKTMLAGSRPGDTWRLTNGFGGVDTTQGNDLLLIAQGTGLAAARAMILETQMTTSTPPRTHLFVCADYPGELYDLLGLWQLAASCPWLSVTPIATHTDDPWWVGATEHSHPPRGLHLTQTGNAGDIIASYGAWLDRDIYIFGTTTFCHQVHDAMLGAGTQEANIHIQDFSTASRWEESEDLITAHATYQIATGAHAPLLNKRAEPTPLPPSPFEGLISTAATPSLPELTTSDVPVLETTDVSTITEEDVTTAASEEEIIVGAGDTRMVVPMSAMAELSTPAETPQHDPVGELFNTLTDGDAREP